MGTVPTGQAPKKDEDEAPRWKKALAAIGLGFAAISSVFAPRDNSAPPPPPESANVQVVDNLGAALSDTLSRERRDQAARDNARDLDPEVVIRPPEPEEPA